MSTEEPSPVLASELPSPTLDTIKGVFMSRSLLSALVFGSMAFCISTTATASNRIDLAKLVNTFLLPAKTASDVGLGWSVGATPGSPITWETSGIADGAQCGVKTPYCRTGFVIVTVNGKATHEVLAQTVQPGIWDIVLGGSRIGISSASIRSGSISYELEGLDIPSILAKAKMKLTKIKCFNESASGGNVLYKVTSPNKKPAWLLNWWSCGSAGCSRTINIYYSAESTQDVQCSGN